MSRTGISYLDVANAAAKVQGESGNPTVDRIREVLGTGSKSTIARHLKDWRANNGPTANETDLPQDLIALVSGLWERVQGKAEQEILDSRQESDQKISAIENTLTQAQKHNAQQQALIHKLEEDLSNDKQSIVALNELLATERIDACKNQERIRNLEDNLIEHKQENTKLHTLLTNVQNNLEHYQASMQKLQQEQSLILEKQKSRYEHELTSLRHQLLVAANDEHGLKLQLEKLQQQVAEFEHVASRNQILEQALKSNEIKAITLEEKYKEIVRQNENVSETLDIKIKQLAEAEQKTAIAISRLSDAEQALRKADDKIAKLLHDQLFIVQEKANFEGQLKQLKTVS